MNIDERLEALTHSVELLAAMHKETDRDMKRLGKYVRSVMQIVLDHETRMRSLEGNDEIDDE
jgi:hemerythrin superfamily protein